MLLKSNRSNETSGPVPSRGARHAFAEGILVEAMNVKTALFFLAFLPQFVAAGEAVALQLALLGSICVALNTLVDVLAVFVAHRVLSSSAAQARKRALARAAGVTMLGLGVFLAFVRRPA